MRGLRAFRQAVLVLALAAPMSHLLTLQGATLPLAMAKPAVQACERPGLGVENAILGAAEAFMIANHRDVFGYARLARVEGDWARVVVVPRIVTDNALLFLHRVDPQGWTVVAGPGTAFFPDDVPGAPEAILRPCPQSP